MSPLALDSPRRPALAALAAALACMLPFGVDAATGLPDGGGGAPLPGDATSDVALRRLLTSQERGARALGLPISSYCPLAPVVTGLAWPLAPNPGIGLDGHGISNFVDINPAFPNLRQLRCLHRPAPASGTARLRRVGRGGDRSVHRDLQRDPQRLGQPAAVRILP